MNITSTLLHGNILDESSPPHNFANAKVFLPGYFKSSPKKLGINEDILSKHTLLIGGTGSGKTNVLYYYIDQLKRSMTQDDVMIIFDTKGDFYDKFYRSGDEVIANSKLYNTAAKWNIYKEIAADGWDDQDVVSNAYEITRSLFRDSIEKNNTQPFFPNAACDLLVAIIICHIRIGLDDLEFKKMFFNNKELKFYLDITTPGKINSFLKAYPDLASVLTYIGDGSSDQALGVMAELQSVVRQIFRGSFAEDGRFSVRNFVRNKGAKTLFIEYDLSIGQTLTPLYRLLFDLALKEAMGRSKSEGNVYLICDEFKLLPNLQHIEDGVNFGRSLGVKVIAGLQSIEQLYEIYGESNGKSIAAGFSTVISFKANDISTRQYISGLYGSNIVLEQYRTMDNVLVEEKREGKTIEDWDLSDLKVGDAIVGFPFAQPFKFHFDEYL